jgi:hypothetical protein
MNWLCRHVIGTFGSLRCTFIPEQQFSSFTSRLLLLLFGSWISDAAPAIAVWESPRSWIAIPSADGNHADWSGPAMATRGATTGAQWVGSSSRGTLRLGQSLLCHVPGRLRSRQPAPQSPVCCCCCFFSNIAITCTIIIIITI